MKEVYRENQKERLLSGFILAAITVALSYGGVHYNGDMFVFAGMTGIASLLCVHPELREMYEQSQPRRPVTA